MVMKWSNAHAADNLNSSERSLLAPPGKIIIPPATEHLEPRINDSELHKIADKPFQGSKISQCFVRQLPLSYFLKSC